MTAKIQTIVDRSGNVVLPRTRIEAITLSDGTTSLEDKLVTFEEGVPTGDLNWDAWTLNGKTADDFSLVDHLHDDRYYTESEVNTLLSSKADSAHTHDDRYYTETEIDNALSLKANLASPTFTGVPLSTTAAAGTNTTQIATTAFVRGEVSAIVDAAPTTLDTLNELAAALGDDPNFATTVATSIGTKAPINNPTFTGTVSGITASMVGLGNVTNESKATMFTNPTLTGNVSLPSSNIIKKENNAEEGGQLTLEKPTNSSLSGNITFDVLSNTVRLFEMGGSYRGAFLDLTKQNASVGSSIITNDNTDGTPIYRVWSGTQAQYNAIATKDNNTLYFVV